MNGAYVALSFRPRSFPWPYLLLLWVSISLSFAYTLSGKLWGVLTKEEYDSVIRELWLFGWNFDEMYSVETSPAFLEVLDKVKPFWNDKLFIR